MNLTTEEKPELIALIRREMDLHGGRIPFERFMELALYHPGHGYYAAASTLPTGRQGDFFTNVSVGALYGEFIGRKMVQIWESLGKPERFTLAEQGAMDGQFAFDLLSWAQVSRADFFAAMDYLLVDPFEANRQRQQEKLGGFGAERVRWIGDWAELESNSIVGAIFSNELIDSFPVHRIVRRNGSWMESFVEWQGDESDVGSGRFAFVDSLIASEALKNEIARLPLPDVEGYVTEVNLRAREWMRMVASRLQRGILFTVDYGFPSELYYRRERNEGTLQCYRAHRSHNDPLRSAGVQDISAHVDFTALMETGEASGLRTVQFIDQHHFLVEMITAGEATGRQYSPKEIRMLKTLLHPEMLGSRFQYLIQER